jgi:hypothetical protein
LANDLDDLEATTMELETVPADANSGVDETLVLVIAAQVQPSEAAKKLEEINSAFGELQGFAMDASENYEVSGAFVQVSPDTLSTPCAELDCPDGVTNVEELQPVELRYLAKDAIPTLDAVSRMLEGPSSFAAQSTLILTGFRTRRGAEEFIELARAAGVGDLVTVQARKLGGGDICLGQEPHPDGSGPLLGPLPDQESYQR